MQLARVVPARRWVQVIMALVIVAIGIQFTLWVSAHLAGRMPTVSRPPGAEGFLPIDGMMATRHLIHTGEIDPIHPAGLAIFLGICVMSIVVAKSFCSLLCPVGLLSEWLGRLGVRLVGDTLTPPKWLDIPLRGLKFLILGFFGWAVWFAMSPQEVAEFLAKPYAKVVDAKMWRFFAPPSTTTIVVLGVLVIGSIFVRDLWCRYLCPYGALVGVLGRFAIFKVDRDSDICTDCRACTSVCPARLPVHRMSRVSSIECTSCQDCVVACPVEACLVVRPPRYLGGARRWLRPVTTIVLAVGLWVVIVGAFRVTGHWHNDISEEEYNYRIQDLDSPIYSHIGGTAPVEE
jgi:polyferredoxin